MIAENISKEDLKLVVNKLGKPKSEINPPKYNFKRRLYWENEDEVVRILEWENNVYNNKKSIFVQSLNSNDFEKYFKMNQNIEWNLLSKGKIKSKSYLTSYIEK